MADDIFLGRLAQPSQWPYLANHADRFPHVVLQMARQPEGQVFFEHLLTQYVLSQVPTGLSPFDSGRFVGKQELVKELVYLIQDTILKERKARTT